MYGYVVNIESSQPLKRLSITELNFDKVAEYNSIQHKLNIENNSNEYSFSLKPIEGFNPNEFMDSLQEQVNSDQPMIMEAPRLPQIDYPAQYQEEPRQPQTDNPIRYQKATAPPQVKYPPVQYQMAPTPPQVEFPPVQYQKAPTPPQVEFPPVQYQKAPAPPQVEYPSVQYPDALNPFEDSINNSNNNRNNNNGNNNGPYLYPNLNNHNNNPKKNRVVPLPKLQPFGSDNKVTFSDNDDFEVIWHKLSYTLPWVPLKSISRRNILKSLNGFFRSSEVTAIMGPSGAGKSTLLEIICGRRKRGVVGEVRIRGADEIKVGFVPQDNYLMELLTVKESFVFASKVINVRKRNFNHNELSDKLIARFGLNSIADTKAKRCSGGQRKRLSIALEIISKPNILILDEPTTGLDSPSCGHIIAILKELVSDKRHPTAIVTTIHQPSVSTFNAFNRVYVLSAMGKCIYHGTPQSLVPTFSKVGLNCDPYTSPADYVIEVAAGDYGQVAIKKMVMEAEGQEMERLVTAGTKPLSSVSQLISHPFWPHLKLLYMRSQTVLYRDPFLTILRVVATLFSSISLAIMFGREVGLTSGCAPRELELYATPVTKLSKKFEHDLDTIMQNVCLLFLGIMVGFLSGLTPTLLNFPKEMHVFHKEYHNGWYSCITYYLAKVFSDIPMQIMTPLTYTVIIYFWSNQPLEIMRFSMLTLISILLALLAQSIGECASAAFMENQNLAVFVGGLVPLPMILFGGFLVKIQRMPVYLQPLSWFSFLRFAFEAMMVSTYGFNRCEYSYQKFLTTINATAVTKPLWAQSLPVMMEYVQSMRNPDAEPKPVTDEDSLKRLYEIFAGSFIKDKSKGIDLDTSLILSFFEINDFTLYTSLAILTAYMFGLKIFTYYVLLVKLHATK